MRVTKALINHLVEARRQFAREPENERQFYYSFASDPHRAAESEGSPLRCVVLRRCWYHGDYAVYEHGDYVASFDPAVVEAWFVADEAERKRLREATQSKPRTDSQSAA